MKYKFRFSVVEFPFANIQREYPFVKDFAKFFIWLTFSPMCKLYLQLCVELLIFETGFGGKTDDISITARHVIFCIFAPLFFRKAGQRFFIEKKASFRLSVSVNLDHSRMLVRISEIKLAYECFCQIRIGGACSSVSY